MTDIDRQLAARSAPRTRLAADFHCPTTNPCYDDYLIRSLNNPRRAAAYLNAALDDGDPRVFLLALRSVAAARGGIGAVAASSKLNRESLYRTLSRKGNPSLQTLGALLSSLGLRLAVESKDAA